MGIISRFTTYIKTLMSSWLDRSEDPGMTLDYAYEQQLEELQNLRRSIADVVTNEKRLELQEAQVQAQMQRLDTQAEQALDANREDLARQALERKQSLQQYLTSYDEQIEQLKAQQQKFMDLEQRLSTRVEAFRAQKEMVKAQYGAAQAQVHIQEATTGLSEDMADVKMAMDRAQDKVLQTQARANAMDELIQSGTLDEIGAGPQDALDQQLAAITSQADQKVVDQQLAALKTRRQLTAGQESQPPEAASPDTPTPPEAGGQNH